MMWHLIFIILKTLSR